MQKFCGAIKFDKDALEIQKELRDEWDRDKNIEKIVKETKKKNGKLKTIKPSNPKKVLNSYKYLGARKNLESAEDILKKMRKGWQ